MNSIRPGLAIRAYAAVCLWASISCAFQQSSIRPLLKRLHSAPSYRYASFGDGEAFTMSSTIDCTIDNNFDDGATKVSDIVRRSRRDQLASQQRTANQIADEARDEFDQFFLLLAFFPPLVAFVSWGYLSQGVSEFIDSLMVGRQVDGGQFAANLLRPTITGVVVPVISIALATLTSTTINVLRERQVELRALVNKEACELRLLRRAVFGMFGTRQHSGRRAIAMQLICEYVEQLERESNVGAVDELKELELSGGIAKNELDRLSSMLHGVDGAAASRQGSVGAAEDLILSLNGHRSDRVALLLSVFPVVHWGVLVALSLSVCLAFLLVSNQDVLQYLNSLQLRTMFAILVGVCSGVAALCVDLADPFRGSYSVTEASTQLGDLRFCLKEDVQDAISEAEEISLLTRNFIQHILSGPNDSSIESGNYYIVPSKKENDDLPSIGMLPPSQDISPRKVGRNKWNSSPSRYGLVSTLYFHLLTGPLGSNVRILGDVIVWLNTFFVTRYRSFSRQINNLFKWTWGRNKGR